MKVACGSQGDAAHCAIFVLLSLLAAACGSPGSDNGAGGSGSSSSGTAAGGSASSSNTAGSSSGSGTGGGGGSTPSGAICDQADPGPLTPTFFVDFDAGDDNADGMTETTAWKHAPGDSNATAAAAATSLVPGDVVLFKGGVVYKGSIDIPASGTMNTPLIYDGNSRGIWGTGRAVIDGELARSSGITASDKSWVLIDSFELKSFDKSTSSTGIEIQDGSHNEVRNCRLSDIYYPTNPGGTSWEAQRGTGIAVHNSPFTSVHHNFVRDVGHAGITFTAGSGVVVDGGQVACNEVTNMNWGIAVALGNSTPGTKITGVSIIGNYIHDFDQYYVSNAWHRDGIFVFARPDTDQATVENLEIAYNYFEDNTSDLGSTAWIYIEYVCKGFNIHHNVLHASRSYYAIRVMGDGFQVEGNHLFANNLIHNANGIGDGMHIQESSGIQLRNNIFYNDGYAYLVATSSMQGFSADYNLMYRVGGNMNVVALNTGPAENPGGDIYDLAGLQAATAHEAHGLYGDPAYSADPTTIDTDPSGFAPKASSPAIDRGMDLGFAKDYLGKPIPAGAAPDMGPFELQP
jgi:hypothetical protein